MAQQDDEYPAATDSEEEGKEFYTFVRTHVIYVITIILLWALSSALISYFSTRQRDEFRVDIEEYRTYKISTFLCAFTLAISIAAFLLLPVSITTNEISWIDTVTKKSLLNGMWSYVFLFSNLSLFILLPFAYFFTESEGFSGSRRGMQSRLRETCVLLIIVAIIVLGLTYTVSCHITGTQLFAVWQHLPFLYSCISFSGALLLLLCTPLGISHFFTNQAISNRTTSQSCQLMVIALAGYSIILVVVNTCQLIFGIRRLPNQSQDESSSNPIGAFMDIVMILYLWCASLCGLYNLPGLCCLRPRKHNSSFNQIIGNCAILCLLSSALPLLARTLGMTNFDLLSVFNRIEWLGNFYIVLLYNVVFIVSTILCLSTQYKNKKLVSLVKPKNDKTKLNVRQRTGG